MTVLLPFLAVDAMLEVWLAGISVLELSRCEPIVFLMEEQSS